MSGPRFSVIPAGAIFDRSLDPRDLQVLGLLGCHIDKAGWCRRSQVKMASQLGCGRASIQRSLTNLCEAGWVEKKRPPWSSDASQPSASYMYRVVLDRDDYDSQSSDEPETDPEPSYAENAEAEGDCPPVGTPGTDRAPSPGAQPVGHPGAQPYVGTGAQPYMGTKNAPLERPPLERERDARAKDRKDKFLAAFKAKWPTALVDDRHRTNYAAAALTEAEQAAALKYIDPFLAYLKRVGRKTIPAGWRYLEDKSWEELAQQAASGFTAPTVYAANSIEARAIEALNDLAGRLEAFWKIYRRSDGSISHRDPVTPQIAALASLPDKAEWPVLTYQQAGAWEAFMRPLFDERMARAHFREGSRAPWPWPPRKDGTISPGEETA